MALRFGPRNPLKRSGLQHTITNAFLGQSAKRYESMKLRAIYTFGFSLRFRTQWDFGSTPEIVLDVFYIFKCSQKA